MPLQEFLTLFIFCTFAFKVLVKENEVPTVARVFSLQRQVIYQIKAERLNYLIKDFISSNIKSRLSFLLSNSEVSSLLPVSYTHLTLPTSDLV